MIEKYRKYRKYIEERLVEVIFEKAAYRNALVKLREMLLTGGFSAAELSAEIEKPLAFYSVNIFDISMMTAEHLEYDDYVITA